MHEQMIKIKKIFFNDNMTSKKKIENLVVFVIILIITIIIINTVLNDGDKKENTDEINKSKTLAQVETKQVSNLTNEDRLKEDLEDILSKIDGVGKVKVLITYSQTSQTIPVYNEDKSKSDTEEKDSRWSEIEK